MALPVWPPAAAALASTSISSIADTSLTQLISGWRSDTRLYTLQAVNHALPLPADAMVESFVSHDAVSTPFALYVNVLLLNSEIELKHLYARPVTLLTALADGSHSARSGYVTQAWSLQSDGGLARKALLIQPWFALLKHTLNSRVWQGHSIIDIVEDVFASHASIAAWRWDEDVPAYVQDGLFARNAGQRSYCAQYRESDFDFVQRLLAEEGIGWRVEEAAEAPGGHRLVFFASSARQPEDAISAASLGGCGIRFHGSSSQEQQDSIQAMAAIRQLGSTATALQGWDYKSHCAISTEVATSHTWSEGEAQHLQHWLSSYDPTGDFIWGNEAEAQFAATRLQEAWEARYKTWLGQGTVRTLKPGTWATITQSTLDPLLAFGQVEEDQQFFFTRVHALGINNLPKELSEAIARTLGHAELTPDVWTDATPDWPHDTEALQHRAQATGYACQFEALRRKIPWRPVLLDETGARPRPRPTAMGPQTAIVVGAQGEASAAGEDELYTDALGRIKVQFHWQAAPFNAQGAHSSYTCWLRVMQRSAMPGGGHQFIPRIGQEVLVGFLNNDMDRPVVVASLYNGRGESGISPTPGGAAAANDVTALAESTDHSPSSQMNLVNSGSGGHSPAWHGAAPGMSTESATAQANAAALSGVKSKEWGGDGYNQLVLDDTPAQLRTQLHSTHKQTWLQMGHLLHQADNHRGSFRGSGFELRTDAWGGVRASSGIMLSTYGLRDGFGQTAEPSGDNAPGMSLARQAQQLADTFHKAAVTHQTVGLSGSVGSTGTQQSKLNAQASPNTALLKRISGVASHTSLPNAQADAQDQLTQAGKDKIPHSSDPNITLTGKAGVGLTAGQDLHLSSDDTTQIASGQDSHWAVGGQAHIQTTQGIGVLAGAIQPGTEASGKGLSLIAARGPVVMEAQTGSAQVASKQTLELKTARGVVNIAAAKKVVLAVSGGASIVIEGGQFTAKCPGKITVKAGKKAMVGPGVESWAMPSFPRQFCLDCMLAAMKAGSPFATV